MRNLRRLAALLAAAALCAALLAGCAGSSEGLELSVCVGAEPVTLDPIFAEEISDQTVLVHLYENLMRVAADGSGNPTVMNGMAKSVDQTENYDGTVTYTFKLRSAKWSDGRAVRAGDFVYAWQRLADPASHSPYAELLSVVAGYDEARASGDMEQLQVTAKNDSTLVVVLNGNYDWFLSEVCTSPATVPLRQDVVQTLKEAAAEKNEQAEARGEEGTDRWWSDPTALVTNGPYQAASAAAGEALVLTANEQYYGRGAGLQTLTFRFAASAEEAQALYDEKTVDAVWPLAEERLAELAADEDWTAIPELGTYAVLFNCEQELLSDQLIRQALCMTIDRNALAQAAGVTALPAEGLVPPGVPESEEEDFRTAGGALLENDPELYADTCQQAKALLEEAGYDRGSDLGELEYLYLDEGSNAAVAEALCQMWREALGVSVTPLGMTEQELWSTLRSGEYSLAGLNLEAVGNDAECFLMEWTSDGPDNVVHFANSAYDTLMAIIASASDGTARLGCLHDAEELILEDYVVAPLYTRGTAWELRDTLTGACRDARGWFCFSGVMTRTA